MLEFLVSKGAQGKQNEMKKGVLTYESKPWCQRIKCQLVPIFRYLVGYFDAITPVAY